MLSDDNNSLVISGAVLLPLREIELSAIRAQGAGGQNVNKVSSAIHLRFDVRASSLPEFYKSRLLALQDQRLSSDGIVIIKAQSHRTQELNRLDALSRLLNIIKGATHIQKVRRPTKATKGSQIRRMDKKTAKGRTKSLRGRVDF